MYLRFPLFALVVIYLINKYEITHFHFLQIATNIILSLIILVIFFNQLYDYLTCIRDCNDDFLIRINLFFFDKQIPGYYLTIFFLPSYLYILQVIKLKKIYKSFFSLFYFIIIIFAIFVTGEKNSLLKLVILLMLICSYYLFIKKSYFSISLLFIFLLFFIILIFNNSYFSYHYMSIIDFIINIFTFDKSAINNNSLSPNNNFHHYIALYHKAISLIIEQPLFGKGLNSYRYICTNNFLPFYLEEMQCAIHPHNYILEILVDTGVFGFVFFATFIFYLFKNFKLNFSNNLNYPYIFVFIAMIFPLLPSGSFFNNHNSVFFWFILSFALVNLKKERYKSYLD